MLLTVKPMLPTVKAVLPTVAALLTLLMKRAGSSDEMVALLTVRCDDSVMKCAGNADEMVEAIPRGATVMLRLLDRISFVDFIADGQVVSEVPYTYPGAPLCCPRPRGLDVPLSCSAIFFPSSPFAAHALAGWMSFCLVPFL